MRSMPPRLALLLVCLLLLCSFTSVGIYAEEKKKAAAQSERPLSGNPRSLDLVTNFVKEEGTSRMRIDYSRFWEPPVESAYYPDEAWYPFSIAPPFGIDEGGDKPWMIYAGSAMISVQPGMTAPPIPLELKIADPPGSRPAYYIVHFKGAIQSEWKQAVIDAGGVSTETYVPNNALVFHLTPKAFSAVSSIPEVDWIGYFEPAYKVDQHIGSLRVHSERAAEDNGNVPLIVTLFGGVDPEAVIPRLQAFGLAVEDDVRAIEEEKYAPASWKPWVLSVTGTRARVFDIARLDGVQYVAEAATVRKLHVFSAGGILQSGDSAAWSSLGASDPSATDASYFPLWINHDIRGQHQMVGISDSGIDYGSDSMFGAPVNPLETSPDYDLKLPKASLRDGSSGPCAANDSGGNHGTGCAASCCQDDHPDSTTEAREPNQSGRGEFGEAIAHEAQLVLATTDGYSGFSPSTQRLQWLDLAGYGASVMSVSWSWCTGATFTYDTQSWLFDDVIDSDEYFLIINAGGNDGNCPTFNTNQDCQTTNWSKNAVDVGASNDLSRWDEMINVSGWGGTGTNGSNKGPDWANPPGSGADDLIFPDIVAIADDTNQSSNPGTITASADGTCENADSGLQLFGGTSGAAPTVAGAVALIHQYFEEGNYSTISDPTAALMKAMLINSAEPMGTTCSSSGRPGGDQGWGRPNLISSLAFGGATGTDFVLNAWDIPNAGGFTASGQFQEYIIDITNDTEPLKITLVWTDVPSGTSTGRPYLVNNLDLRLEKGGTQYFGNNFDPSTGYSVSTTTAADGANTVENIFLSSAQVQALGTGTATLRVSMANAPTGRNQGYALVVVGGLAPSTEVYFDRNSYSCSDTIVVTAVDTSPSATATVTSPTDSERVVLSSIGNDRYQGSVTTAEGDTTTDNGILGIAHGDSISVDYETIYTDNAVISCSMEIATTSVTVSGGCDSWDPNDPTVNTGEKYRPYMDTDELVGLTYIFENQGTEDITNVWAEISDSAGCLTFHGANPVFIGTALAGDIAGATWPVEVGTCADVTSSTLSLSVVGDGHPLPTVLDDITTTINADDAITEQSECFNHSSADMVDLPWTAYSFADIGWTRSTSPTCGYENRVDGPCDDSAAGMYKQRTCGVTNMTAESAGALVPPSPIALINSGNAPNGQPWRYAMKRFSFYGATSVPAEDEVFWGLYFEDQYTSSSQITDGSTPYDENGAGTGWGWSLAFFSMESFECCGETPTAWNWETANTGVPDVSDFCGATGDAPENQLNICFGSATSGVSEAGEIGAAGENYLNFAVEALEEQLLGEADGTATGGFGVDNLELVWEEFYATANTGNCSVSGQCGQISFDLRWYQTDYTGETATITVADSNAGAGPLTVTITSDLGGDSEDLLLTKQGSDPIYVGTIPVSTDHGIAPDDGTLFVVPHDDLTGTYDDSDNGAGSPCTDTAISGTWFPEGAVGIDSRNYYFDNGDDDGYPDTNETVTFELTIANNMDTDLTNAVVSIETLSPNVLCVLQESADFGTIPTGGTANNPDLERFQFQIDPSYECSDPNAADTATFIVHITGDGLGGAPTVQKSTFVLDVDDAARSAESVVAGYSEQSDSRVATCGNAYYDDGDPENSSWFGGGQAGNPDCILAEYFDPADFSMLTDYEISSICFGNELDWGGPWPNRWRIHPDSSGAPDDTVTLAEGVMSTGDGAGQVEYAITPAVAMTAGEPFWIFVRGDSGCCNNEDFNLDVDETTSLGHRWANGCDGLSGLTQQAESEFVIHTTIASTASYTCDTNDNSLLPNFCIMEVDVTPDGTTQACGGSDIVFTANVSRSVGTVTYQWTEGGIDLPGETGGTLTISHPSVQSQTYNCKATDDLYADVTDPVNSVGQWIACAPDVQYDSSFDPSGTLVEICGDGDAVVEPGEQWEIDARLINNGTASANAVTADLGVNAASNGDVNVTGGNPGSYGTIGVGNTAQPALPYEICVDAAMTCPGSVTFDVVNLTSAEGGYPDETAAFSVNVGAVVNENVNQNSAIVAQSSTVASDFTPATTAPVADTAAVSYNYSYTGGGTATIFGPDDNPFGSGSWTTVGGAAASAVHCGHSDTYYRMDRNTSTDLVTTISTVGLTNVHVIFDYTGFNLDAGELLHLDWHDGATWQTDVWAANVNSWQCGVDVALPAGAEGIANLDLRFRLNSGNVNERAGIDYITVQGDASGVSWTDSARIEFYDLTSWQLLKDYGAADGNPYDVTAHYNGPGTYQIRVTEQDGGSAEMTGALLNVQTTQCDTGGCCDDVPEISGDPGNQMTLQLNGGLIDLTFEDAGAYNYNVYVSTLPESIAADPFDVESPNGKHDCALSTTDLGAMRSITAYDVESGIAASSVYYILVGADNGSSNGPLGGNTAEGERTATSHCVP